jgi:hypothetical protein
MRERVMLRCVRAAKARYSLSRLRWLAWHCRIDVGVDRAQHHKNSKSKYLIPKEIVLIRDNSKLATDT